MNIGIVGTDSSHAIAFTRLLNGSRDQQPLPGGRVISAYPGGSRDFPLSIGRVEGFMAQLETDFGISRAESPEEVAERCDAILLTSADGRTHLDLFKRIAAYGKPVFIDKPLALTTKDANEIFRIARQRNLPVMSASALRYAERLVKLTAEIDRAGIRGANVRGPLLVEPTQSLYFWYGIHAIEMLYAIMGPGCTEVIATGSEEKDAIRGHWSDGRMGTVTLLRKESTPFSASIATNGGTKEIEILPTDKPFYASLLERVLDMFHTGRSPVDWIETVELIRFMEAAEESRRRMKLVRLHPPPA